MKELLKKYFISIYKLYEQYINPPLAKLMKFTGYPVERSAHGSWVIDHLHRRWLDCCSCYGAISLGHLHPKIVAAHIVQLSKMALSSKVCLNPTQGKLARRLEQITPGNLQYCFFSNSGAEANEAALKTAVLATKRCKFVSTHNSFHGKSLFTLMVSGRKQYKDPFESILLLDVTFIPFNDVEALKAAIDDTVAAFIVEPIQGEGGIHVASLEFLQAAQEFCNQHGVVYILDEVQTGFGRTGKMFAIDHYPGVVPDIMTFAKALGGGIMPIGATIVDRDVWHCAYKDKNPTLHTSTFGGNPLACCAGLTTIEVLKKEHLPERAKISGEYLLTHLRLLANNYPELIAEVRGLGLLIGVAFRDEGLAGKVMDQMKSRRVIAVYTTNQPQVIRIEPPLNISQADLDTVLEAFTASVESAEQLRVRMY